MGSLTEYIGFLTDENWDSEKTEKLSHITIDDRLRYLRRKVRAEIKKEEKINEKNKEKDL